MAEAIALRRANLRERIVAALATCIVVQLTVGWNLVWLWAAAYVLVQGLETWASSGFGSSPAVGSRRPTWLLAALALSSVVFSGLAVPLVLYGGREGELTGLFLICGALINSVTVSKSSPRVFAALAGPMAVCALVLPAMKSVILEGPVGLVIVLAPMMTLLQALRGWTALSRARVSELQARALVEQRSEDVERAMAAKSAFVAMVSHELRTPLSGVLATSQELQRRLERESNLEAASVLIDAGQHMVVLLNDLLDLSKLEAGKMTYERISFDPAHLINSLERHWGAAARKRGLPLQLRCANDLPRSAKGDPTRLRQVLDNLLSNALKFTGSEGVRWCVDMSETQAGFTMTVRVSDTGPGIAPDRLSQLFTPYQQMETSVARTHGGTGLGLAVSRELVRGMGGELSVESQPGQGATFVLHLPLARAALPADGERVAEAHDGRLNEGLRILVVDDHPVNRRTLAILLQPAGAELTMAESGSEALAILAVERFDAVLTDVNMPDMDGPAMVRAIRGGAALDPRVPVLPSRRRQNPPNRRPAGRPAWTASSRSP